jgi:ABC-type transport system substrate-binding protein
LLTDAGYPDGFDMEIITYEAWKVEAQIISKMLERIGISVRLEILTHPEWIHRLFVSENLFEEQSWDMAIGYFYNWCGHTAPGFLTFDLLEETRSRWIEYDPVYEDMFKEMAMILDSEVQEEKIRQMVRHLYDRAYFLFIYSPLTLYAVNAEVNFVPQMSGSLLLKETSVTDSHWSLRGKNN